MFGKRTSDPTTTRKPIEAPAPSPAQPKAAAPAASGGARAGAEKSAPEAAPKPPPAPPKSDQRRHSEEYYDVKTTVFDALIDTIDLTQLAKLDAEAAR